MFFSLIFSKTRRSIPLPDTLNDRQDHSRTDWRSAAILYQVLEMTLITAVVTV